MRVLSIGHRYCSYLNTEEVEPKIPEGRENMKRFVISLILVFALTSHAYGMGWRPECIILGKSCSDSGTVSPGGNAKGGTTGTTGNNPGGTTGGNTAGNNGTNNGPGNSGFIVTTSTSDGPQGPSGSGTQAVPEPLTVLLLGSGLIGLAALRKKFRK